MSTQNVNVDMKGEKEVTIGGIVYLLNVTGEVTLTPKEQGQPQVEPPAVDPTKPPITEKPSTFGTIKDGAKWSKNPGPSSGWIVKSMDNPKDKFKIVAPDGLNVIADLPTEADAKALIEYFKTNVFPPKGNDGSEVEEPDDKPTDPVPTPTPGGAVGPYQVTDQQNPVTQRGPTKRTYRSNKPDDWTIEKNSKGIKFKNIQAVFDITVPKEMEHDDNLSIKGGGNHMRDGWFDNGISIYEGQTCLGTEKKHPSTKLCVVKGKKYGDLRGKRVKVASTFFTEQNKTEFWVNIPGVTNGWDKSCEGTDVGGFNPKAGDDQEIQLRIDGFKDKNQPPEIHGSWIQEIKI